MEAEPVNQADQASEEFDAQIRALEAKVSRLKANKDTLLEDFGRITCTTRLD